jgi:hypothetical protein
VPATVERIDYRISHPWHFRFVLAEAFDHRAHVGHQPAVIELETIGNQREVGAFVLQDMKEPVRELDVAIARAFGVPQRLDEGVITQPVELASDCLKTDIRHIAPTLTRIYNPFLTAKQIACA